METARYSEDGLDALPVGATIGGFAIRRLIGAGGFGITYEAHNRVTGKGVAIKEFFPSSMVRRDGASRLTYSKVNEETITWALRKFEETTTTLCGLEHPNIVRVHDYVPANDTGYMIMELLDGQTLKDWLKARGQPPRLDELRPLVDPVMEALSYVHGRGLIHRDIAPDNILITAEGRPVLIDFGSVSRDLSDARQKAMSGTVGLAKRHYTAPEQMRAKSRPTPEADVYSMGAVLYRALAGTEPADGQDRVDALFHGNEADPYTPLMGRLPAGCPARAAQAIDKALAVRPEGRIHTMADLRGELGAPAPPAVIVDPLPPPPPRPLGKWLIGGAVALVLVGGVVTGTLLMGRPINGDAVKQQSDAARGANAADSARRRQAELDDREARLREQQADFDRKQQAIERQRQQDAESAAKAEAGERARQAQAELDEREDRLRQQQADFDRRQQAQAQQREEIERQHRQDDEQRQIAAQAQAAEQARQARAELDQREARQRQNQADVDRQQRENLEHSLWEHNGSVVRLVSSASKRRFLYEEPSSRIRGLGVKRGTLLFNGERIGRMYSGTAYVFSSECGPAGYHVEGSVADDQRSVTMTGMAPHRDASCRVTEHHLDKLHFKYSGNI